jgi:predicted nucleic acid-binding protein
MPGDKIFLDTNILIYAYDVSAGKKHEMAKTILMDLWNSGRGILSIQVLQEFFVNITKKVSKPLGVKLAKDIIRDLLKWEVVIIDGESLLEVIEIHSRHQYSVFMLLMRSILSLVIQCWKSGVRGRLYMKKTFDAVNFQRKVCA